MPGDSKKIRDIAEVVLENNRMLHKMRRNAFLGAFFKIVFYALMFGLPLYLYFSFLQPTVGSFLNAYNKIQQTAGTDEQQTSPTSPSKAVFDIVGKLFGGGAK